MDDTLELHLSEELCAQVQRSASAQGQTPEEWAIAALLAQLAPRKSRARHSVRTRRDDKLRAHFGCVNLGGPTGVDNDQIDADLARAYAEPHLST